MAAHLPVLKLMRRFAAGAGVNFERAYSQNNN
jgi:hypothetical protein